MQNSLGAGIFPNRLHKILEDSEISGNQHIVSWLPCGRFFKVHDSKEFARVIMPSYFRHSRFKSFLRSLSQYKFQRVSKGPCAGAYGHPHFLRGRLDLCRHINRYEVVVLGEAQEPILKVSMDMERKAKANVEPLDAFPAFNKMPKKLDTFSKENTPISLAAFGIDGTISPLMEPTKDHPSWSLFNNTPPDILDEIIFTFASPKPFMHFEW